MTKLSGIVIDYEALLDQIILIAVSIFRPVQHHNKSLLVSFVLALTQIVDVVKDFISHRYQERLIIVLKG